MEYSIEFYNCHDYTLKLVKECEELAYSLHVDNGGTLRRTGLVAKGSDGLLCAIDDNGKIIGFIALNIDRFEINDLYIRQIAVAKEYMRQGIASNMINYVIDNLKSNFEFLTAEVRKDNVASNGFFASLGFHKISKKNSKSDLYLRSISREEEKQIQTIVKK